MQIPSQLPALSHSQSTASGVSLPVQSFSKSKTTSVGQPSSMSTFETAQEYGQSSRFQRINDLDLNAQAALQAYKKTELLSSANPRNTLIGVDVFA